jgi:hypothetical protein
MIQERPLQIEHFGQPRSQSFDAESLGGVVTTI